MDRIHDKANKLINEVRKKKIKVSNINHKDRGKDDIRNVSDLTDNSCLFCEKVFISSNYLMKHVYRRHAENLIKLHKRCLLLDSNSSSDIKNLFTFLEEEFLVLKNELSIVKQAIGHKVPRHEVKEKSEESNKESVEYVRHMNKNYVASDIAVADINSSEIDLLKEKVHNIESNIQCLHKKFEEFNSMMKTEVLSRQDIPKHKVLKEENCLMGQESQLDELRQILLKELKCVLSKELNENNSKSKSNFTELKHDILKLDHIISGLRKQIDSPDYLTVVEKRLEQHIVNFLGTSKRSVVRRRNSRVRNKLSLSKGHSTCQNAKILETDNCDNQIINSSIPESMHPRSNLECNKLHVSPKELSFLIAEKLSHFNISDTTSKLSNSEYEEKLKLINSVKDSLSSKKYPNFSEIYKNIDMYANHRVLSKLKSKKSRKQLRFSEPLTSSEDRPYNLKRNVSDILNKSYPVLEDKNKQVAPEYNEISPCDIKSLTVLEKQRFIIPSSEGFSFPDVGGGGECSGNFPGVYRNTLRETFVHTSTKECKTSSQIDDVRSSEKADCGNEKDSSFINLSIYSDAYKNTGSASVFGKQEMPFSKSLQMGDNAELNGINSEVDNFDDNSLKSLSSWEDEENSYVNDRL